MATATASLKPSVALPQVPRGRSEPLGLDPSAGRVSQWLRGPHLRLRSAKHQRKSARGQHMDAELLRLRRPRKREFPKEICGYVNYQIRIRRIMLTERPQWNY